MLPAILGIMHRPWRERARQRIRFCLRAAVEQRDCRRRRGNGHGETAAPMPGPVMHRWRRCHFVGHGGRRRQKERRCRREHGWNGRKRTRHRHADWHGQSAAELCRPIAWCYGCDARVEGVRISWTKSCAPAANKQGDRPHIEELRQRTARRAHGPPTNRRSTARANISVPWVRPTSPCPAFASGLTQLIRRRTLRHGEQRR